jgi:hypothetical protein
MLAMEAIRLAAVIVTVFHLLALAVNHYIGIARPLHYAGNNQTLYCGDHSFWGLSSKAPLFSCRKNSVRLYVYAVADSSFHQNTSDVCLLLPEGGEQKSRRLGYCVYVVS